MRIPQRIRIRIFLRTDIFFFSEKDMIYLN